MSYSWLRWTHSGLGKFPILPPIRKRAADVDHQAQNPAYREDKRKKHHMQDGNSATHDLVSEQSFDLLLVPRLA